MLATCGGFADRCRVFVGAQEGQGRPCTAQRSPRTRRRQLSAEQSTTMGSHGNEEPALGRSSAVGPPRRRQRLDTQDTAHSPALSAPAEATNSAPGNRAKRSPLLPIRESGRWLVARGVLTAILSHLERVAGSPLRGAALGSRCAGTPCCDCCRSLRRRVGWWNVGGRLGHAAIDPDESSTWTLGPTYGQVNLSSGAVSYLVADARGSLRGALSASGTQLTASTSYDAYGNPESFRRA